MRLKILSVVAGATAAIVPTVGEARADTKKKHLKGCSTPECDSRIGRKWWRKHHPRPKLSAPVTASWYGPGFYGKRMGCGGTMSANDDSVANKELPCYTKIKICLVGGRCTHAVVRDRGPYVGGRTFDLTPGVKNAIGMAGGTAQVRYAVVG